MLGCLRNASNGDGIGLLLATYWYVAVAICHSKYF
jgi:hypothetical protein